MEFLSHAGLVDPPAPDSNYPSGHRASIYYEFFTATFKGGLEGIFYPPDPTSSDL